MDEELERRSSSAPARRTRRTVVVLLLVAGVGVVAALAFAFLRPQDETATPTEDLVPTVEGRDFTVVGTQCSPKDTRSVLCPPPGRVVSDGVPLRRAADGGPPEAAGAGDASTTARVAEPGDEVWVLVGRKGTDARFTVGFGGTIAVEDRGTSLFRVSGMPAGDLEVEVSALAATSETSTTISFYERVPDDAAEAGPPCPAELPYEDETWSEPAPSAPELPAFARAWRCRYGADTSRPDDLPGLAWRRDGDAVQLSAPARARLARALDRLEPHPRGQVCRLDLGPRWVVVLDHADGRTAVVLDDFGCGWVRLSEDLATVPPGETSGALTGPRELLTVASGGRARGGR